MGRKYKKHKKHFWTEPEINLLCEQYATNGKQQMMRLFSHRTYASINLKAFNLGLRKRYERHPYVEADLSCLLLENLRSYYWVGFLLADGGFYENRLRLGLAKQDRGHLISFCDYIQCVNSHENEETVYVAVQDKFNVPKIMKKFNILPVKTYNPPPRDNVFCSEDLFIAFFIGFIDGDGNIQKQSGGRRDCFVRIKIHSTWLGWLWRYVERLYGLVGVQSSYPKINSEGYAEWVSAHSSVLTFLKKSVLRLKLPVLNRKWDLVDETFVSHQKAKDNRNRVIALARQGMKNATIAAEAGLSLGQVYYIRKREKI